MTRRSIRLTAVPACLFLLCLALASGASAAITSTRITSPADGSYFLQEASGTAAEVTVSGTVESSGNPGSIELRCYSEPENSTAVEAIEEGEEGEGLHETSKGKWAFSVTVPVEEFGESPCVLRAVPEGTAAFLGPGAATSYEGARVAFSELSARPDQSDGATIGWLLEARTLSTIFEVENAGQCGLGPTSLLSTPGLAQSAALFECAGSLRGGWPGATRADIQVDGHNAYDPAGADTLFTQFKPAGKAPSIELKSAFDPATGLTTLHETDPLVECKGKTLAYPETGESCEELISAPISLERSWTPSAGGRLITMSDAWRSTDGAEHAVSALYHQELNSDPTSPGTYEFPGTSPSFAATRSGEAITLGSGGGTILYREDGAAAEAPGGAHPVGGLIYETAPGEPIQVSAGSAETTGSSSLTMPYSFTVTPSAPATLTMAFAEGYTTGEVCAFAEAAGSDCPHPPSGGEHETGETPARGPTTTTTTTTGTGTGSPSSGSSAPTAHRRTAARVLKGTVVIPLTCSGPAGTSCAIKAALTTLEKLRGGRPAALAASTRTVTVGSLAASIPAGAGRTMTIRLNAAGRALLARFHKLPLHLAVVQQLSGARAAVASQSLALK